VVIVGGRYGSLASDNVSYTEKEYEYALERRIPVLAFLPSILTGYWLGRPTWMLNSELDLNVFGSVWLRVGSSIFGPLQKIFVPES
jgi:hypothetical protein